MYFPQYNDVPRSREMTAVFGGYNHRLSCAEGEFYDMKNMTTDFYPILSPRKKRGKAWELGACRGMASTNGHVYWVDGMYLYRDGEKIADRMVSMSYVAHADMPVMGSSIVFASGGNMLTCAYDTNKNEFNSLYCMTESTGGLVELSPSTAEGTSIEISDHDEEPADGEYRAAWVDGKKVLRQWSESTSTWISTPTNHCFVEVDYPNSLGKGDCVKITIDLNYPDGSGVYELTDTVKGLFPNEEEGNKRSVETYVVELVEKVDNGATKKGIVIPGSIAEYVYIGGGIRAERIIPMMDFIVECDNRLWGVAYNGHEIYSCKLGDFKNWRVFRGISTDSYAVNIGSDGVFTGAITYLNTPIFFKEDSMIRIYPSPTGAHQVKETKCRGLQFYCHRSLCVINEVLYYKSKDCICAFDGSLPVSVSENFGEVRYENAVAGTIGNKYYISMSGGGRRNLFVYDVVKHIWTREDEISVSEFCRHEDDLYMSVKEGDKERICTVNGTLPTDDSELEDDFEWYVESGMIGFNTPDNKYVSKLTIRLSMEPGTNVDVYLQYDSSGTWEHVFNMSGTGTKSVNVPVLPRRCDHFRYKISGVGDCKIFSITKTIEEGSDVR